ncbi:unnamed protein product, partial [Mesorhabditis spiculigera]
MLGRSLTEVRPLQRSLCALIARAQFSGSACTSGCYLLKAPETRNDVRSKHVESVVVKKTKSTKRPVDVYENMTIKELVASLGEDFDSVSDVLFNIDQRNLEVVAENKPIDKESLAKLLSVYNARPRLIPRPKLEEEDLDLYPQPAPPASECVKRSPVVTIMGHVDHGKTTLLDALRSSRIVEGEFGGITQHIGAFSVDLKGAGRRVTFLDTPGHSAFAAMRERGARATDIVVLVVAADDGVKEQTVQSIKFAQDAGVPIVVAVNKVDKPEADPERAKRDLLQHNVVVESLGGESQCIEVSALYRKNLPAIQEAILIQADLMELKSTKNGLVEGVVIESTTQHGVGKVCTVLVTRGVLKKGKYLVCGHALCRVRTMTDENGKPMAEAGPSTPVQISGWKEELPTPGDQVLEAPTADRAQKCIDYRAKRAMESKAAKDWEEIAGQREEERAAYLANRQALLDKGWRYGSTIRQVVHKTQKYLRDEGGQEKPSLAIILRTDVEGTLEAILDVINTYSSEKCDFQLVDFGVGAPTEKELELAKDTNAIIYNFNLTVPPKIRAQAESEGVRIEGFNVIYRLVDGLKAELNSRLPLVTELEPLGEGHILKEFLLSDRGRKKQPVAGVLVDWGSFGRTCIFRFSRLGAVYYEGPVESMKCANETVGTAKTNTEVGLLLPNKEIRFKTDDQVVVLEKKEVRQEIDWYPSGF